MTQRTMDKDGRVTKYKSRFSFIIKEPPFESHKWPTTTKNERIKEYDKMWILMANGCYKGAITVHGLSVRRPLDAGDKIMHC